MNINNLAQRTNFTAGSNAFQDVPFFLTALNIPGFNLSHVQVGGRNSTKMFTSADTVTWNPLSFDMLIDEDFIIYTELMNTIRKNINVDTGDFSNFSFDFWIELNNNKGNKVLKIEFKNCRIESIGDIQLDTQDDATENVLNVSMLYDFYNIDHSVIPVLLV